MVALLISSFIFAWQGYVNECWTICWILYFLLALPDDIYLEVNEMNWIWIRFTDSIFPTINATLPARRKICCIFVCSRYKSNDKILKCCFSFKQIFAEYDDLEIRKPHIIFQLVLEYRNNELTEFIIFNNSIPSKAMQGLRVEGLLSVIKY